jgi:glutamate-1-semialdehyde 2,1-aminomutase
MSQNQSFPKVARNSSSQISSISARAHELIPGGAHTYAKGDDQFPSNAPPFIERGNGCYVWDRNGERFMEYGMGLRAVGLGHAYPSVIAAAREALSRGTNFSRPCPIEVEAAEALLDLIPGADMVKFAKNGSDVTTAAVRLARAVTGRNHVGVCKNHPFFSTDDWFIATTPMPAGIPQSSRDLTKSFAYNDFDSVDDLFEDPAQQIACLIMEVEKEVPPAPGFLEHVRDQCSKHGALLIFDEIITGFRHHLHGAQSQHNIVPDLSTFSKAMGNGFSVAALVGKRKFMEVGGISHEQDRVFLLSTTHGAETHSLAAAIETINVYKTKHVIARLFEAGARLRTGIEEITADLGLETSFGVLGRDSNLIFYTRDAAGQPSQPLRTLFMQEMIKAHIICPSFVISFSHTDDDIDRTLDAISRALEVYKKALEPGQLDRLLVGPSVKPVFRPKC